MAFTLRCSHHSCLFSLDNSLSVLLKLNKQLKISSNNSPRTNQGISDLNTRNMEFFRLELEGIWQFEILEAQKVSSNNSPRTNQGISYLNTRNMEFFSD
jgi:hypothetical protein